MTVQPYYGAHRVNAAVELLERQATTTKTHVFSLSSFSLCLLERLSCLYSILTKYIIYFEV